MVDAVSFKGNKDGVVLLLDCTSYGSQEAFWVSIQLWW